MKTVVQKTNTQVGSQATPRQFAIAANEQSFATLSSGLYNDKIRAIIRELSCNAWDAHVMAGKSNVPFEIHLPTDFEPFFRITDFGTGLRYRDHGCEPCRGTGKIGVVADGKVVTGDCPACYGTGNLDEVLSLYCTYFASNKRDSNDVVGALGLGSKSPFCYTQAQDDSQGFTVTNRYQGVKRIYSAYVENGAPTCVCLSEEKTKEPDGLEIQFACNLEDVLEFENKAKLALEFFSPAPVVNIEAFEPTVQQYAIKTDKWALRKEPTFPGLRAIQGMVQYTVGNIDVSRMSTGQQQVADLPLDLFFSIGELKPTASRESLSLDNRTQENILKLLGQVAESMVQETRKQLEACKTAWQARIQLNHLLKSDMADLIREAYDAGRFFGKYPNFVLSADKPGLNQLDYEAMQVTEFEHRSTKKAYRRNIFKMMTPTELAYTESEIQKTPKLRDSFTKRITHSENIVLILNDIGKSASKYTDAYVQSQTGQQNGAYLFSAVGGMKHQKKMLAEFKRAIKQLGDPEYVLASYLKQNFAHLIVKPTPKPRVTGILVLSGTGYSHRGGENSGWMSNTWSKVPETQLPAGPKFYMPVGERSVGLTPKGLEFFNAREAVRFINNARHSELFTHLTEAKIYGLTEKNLKHLDKSEWINVFDYIIDNAQSAIPDSKILELSLLVSPFLPSHQDIMQKIRKQRENFSKDSPFLNFADAYLPLKRENTVETRAISELVQTLKNAKLYKQVEVTDFATKWSRMIQNYYPLLNFISSYGSGVKGLHYDELVLDYISRMDSESGYSKEAV